MKDVAGVLATFVGQENLPMLLAELEATATARGNKLFTEYLRRIRKAAGIADPPPPEPGPLLDLMRHD